MILVVVVVVEMMKSKSIPLPHITLCRAHTLAPRRRGFSSERSFSVLSLTASWAVGLGGEHTRVEETGREAGRKRRDERQREEGRNG